ASAGAGAEAEEEKLGGVPAGLGGGVADERGEHGEQAQARLRQLEDVAKGRATRRGVVGRRRGGGVGRGGAHAAEEPEPSMASRCSVQAIAKVETSKAAPTMTCHVA